MTGIDASLLPLSEGQTTEQLCEEIFPVIFDPAILPKRVNQADGEDLILTSACNYYDGVTQAEAEAFYNKMKDPKDIADYVLESLKERSGFRIQDDMTVVAARVWTDCR